MVGINNILKVECTCTLFSRFVRLVEEKVAANSTSARQGNRTITMMNLPLGVFITVVDVTANQSIFVSAQVLSHAACVRHECSANLISFIRHLSLVVVLHNNEYRSTYVTSMISVR